MPDRHGRYSRDWNPLMMNLNEWQFGEIRLKAIVDHECQKINSMKQPKFFKYVKTVTSSMIGPITFPFFANIVWPHDDTPFINPEVLANTVKSILDCIQSRLEGKFHFEASLAVHCIHSYRY